MMIMQGLVVNPYNESLHYPHLVRNNFGGHNNYDGYDSHDSYNNHDGYNSNNFIIHGSML